MGSAATGASNVQEHLEGQRKDQPPSRLSVRRHLQLRQRLQLRHRLSAQNVAPAAPGADHGAARQVQRVNNQRWTWGLGGLTGRDASGLKACPVTTAK